jgi:hypothetical protein
MQRDLHEHIQLAGADIDHQPILYIPSYIPNFSDRSASGQWRIAGAHA